jgi:WD40 repeat protein
MLALVYGGNYVRVWDIATTTSIATFKGHAKPLRGIAFSHDAKLLATASYDNTIKIWDLEAGVDQMPPSPVNGGLPRRIKRIKGGKTLISASSDKTLQLWDIPTASRTATLTGCTGWPYSIAVAHDSELLASTSKSDGHIQLWNMATGAHIATIEGHVGSLFSAPEDCDIGSMPPMFEQDGSRRIKVWQPYQDKYFDYGYNWSVVSAIAFSHDSQLLASASAVDGIIKVWDVGSGACIAILAGHSSWVNYLAFLPQADVLVSSSGDRTIRIWDIGTAACTATFEGQSEPWNESIAFSHDYKLLASGKDDGSIDVWDISTGERRMKLAGESRGRVYIVAFSQSPGLLASIASRRQGLYNSQLALDFWNVSTGLRLAGVDISRHTLHCFSFDKVRPCLSISVGKFELKGTYEPHSMNSRC